MFKEWLYSGAIKNWTTTLFGLLGGIYIIVEPIISSGQMPTKNQWILAAFSVVGGFLAKSFYITGGVVKQDTPMVQKSDITASEMKDNKTGG